MRERGGGPALCFEKLLRLFMVKEQLETLKTHHSVVRVVDQGVPRGHEKLSVKEMRWQTERTAKANS